MRLIESDSVRQSAAFVMQHAHCVSIREDRLLGVAQQVICGMQQKKYSPDLWHSHPLTPKALDASTLNWIFVVDLLNFSFWSDDPYFVTHEGIQYTGYWSLCAAINKALAAGIPATDPAYYGAAASEADLCAILRSSGKGEMPMVEERARIWGEAGRVLLAKFEGSVERLVQNAAGDPFRLINLVVANFHSFFDVSTYRSQPVFLLKRAQILVADIWACFGGQSYGNFNGHAVDQLTMFADYRLPQILQALGLLELSSEFQVRLQQSELLCVHIPEVIELRAASVHAVELLRGEILRSHSELPCHVNAVVIDFYLWDLVKEYPEMALGIPIHKTRSCFY